MAGIDNLKPFKKGYDPRRNVKGAPLKTISELTDLGYTTRQISDTQLNIIALSKKQIEQIADNEDSPILERMIAKAILKDFSKSSLWNLETLLNRAIGKPKETTAVENSGKIEFVVTKGKTIL